MAASARGKASGMLPAVPFDALVVLGCSVESGRLSPAALRRVERAAQAYREHGATLVIASGGKAWQGQLECDVFGQGLLERGVPPERLLKERESQNTRGNARGVQPLLLEHAARRVGLVTCDWHMPRALRLFQPLGLELTALPAPAPARPLAARGARWLRERASLTLDLALLRLHLEL